MPRDAEFKQRVCQIDELVREIEQAGDPSFRTAAKALIQSLMDLHGAGIERMLEIVHLSGDHGQAIIDQMGREDPVRGLLLLYGLHPLDMKTRVEQAFQKAQLQLRSHGASAELVGIDEQGMVRVRLELKGCSANTVAIQSELENAIREA